MCWNATVSLNTFAFAMFTMVLAGLNKYRGYELSMYIFYLSFACMQLVEGVTWLTLDDPSWNAALSVAALALVILQPAASIMTIAESSAATRNRLIMAYGVFVLLLIAWMVTSTTSTDYRMVRASNGHLEWKWLSPIFEPGVGLAFLVGWMCFFLLPQVVNRSIVGFSFLLGTFLLSVYTYHDARTIGSMWCWIANVAFVKVLLDILFFQPCGLRIQL